MKDSSKKFLEFNGKSILFLSKNGQWWIAIKPICEALNVNYNRQFQNLKQHPILGPAFANQQMQVGTDQLRNYACLPEKFVYGWIFSINSASEELMTYQKECYEILYNYFHGAITERTKALQEKTNTQIRIEQLESELLQNEQYKEMMHLKKVRAASSKELTSLDHELIKNQIPLWREN